MIRITLAQIIIMAICTCASINGAESLYISKEFTFKIAPPAVEGGGQVIQLASFFLPGQDAFAPNVSIQVQRSAKTIKEFDELNIRQFAQMKFTEIKKTILADQIILEFSGTMRAHSMHFYSRSVKVGDRFYVITAVALAEHWEKDSPTLIASVDSFQLTP